MLPRHFLQHRLQHTFDQGQQQNHHRGQQNGHTRVLYQQKGHQESKYDAVGDQLQQCQDQSIHIVHIGRNIPLDYRCVRMQIEFITPAQIVAHHALGGAELVGIDKSQRGPLLKKQKQILDHIHQHQPQHHQHRKPQFRPASQQQIRLVEQAGLMEGLTVHHRLHHGENHPHSQGLQPRADHHQHHQASHGPLLGFIQ